MMQRVRQRNRSMALAAACALLLAAVPGRAGDVEAARRLYEQARAETNPQRQAQLLRESIAQQDTFEARYALGSALAGTKAFAAARQEFQKALELSADAKGRARARAQVGETFVAEGRKQEGLALLRQSQQDHPYPNVAARLRELEIADLDRPMPASEIASTLKSTASRAFGVKPAVSLRIGFDLDKATLNASGERQARELGQALAGMAGKPFRIVGHTDKQGDETYNQKLSVRRAETVRDFLVRNHGLNASLLSTEGRGERELLYPGDTAEDHALNRRVEVVVGD